MKRLTALITATLCIIIFNACAVNADVSDEYAIALNNGAVTVNGETAPSAAGGAVYVSSGENYVINIVKAGTYRVTGTIDNAQIIVNAGDTDAVTIILDNAEINCQTAPAILIKNAYDPEKAGEAGVKIVLADKSENSVSGTGSDDNDGTISSDISFVIEGGGLLNVTSGNEGIETNMHLTINSGDIVINSSDDAINGSEDGVSHIMINGGSVYAGASSGVEGDGIDSNGYLTINGGTVVALAHPSSMDGGLDADMGVFINGGTVVSVGSMQSELSDTSSQRYLQLMFAAKQEKDTLVSVKDANGSEVVSFEVPQTFSAIAFSSPNLKDGTYYVYTNGVQQQHFGTSSEMGGMGRPFGGTGAPLEGMERMAPPDGQAGTPPEGMGELPERRERPEGFGAMPDGTERPEGFGAPPEGRERPEGLNGFAGFGETAGSGEASTEFIISGTGITFRGVSSIDGTESVQNEAPENNNDGQIRINLKGEELPLDVAPIIENGRTLVPLRVIFEALGMEVEYNNGEIVASKEGLIIKTTVGSNIAYKNGEEIVLDVGSKIVNGRTLVPVRFIAESAGLNVDYKEELRTVNID